MDVNINSTKSANREKPMMLKRGGFSLPALNIKPIIANAPPPAPPPPKPTSGFISPTEPCQVGDKVVSSSRRFRAGYAEMIGFRDKMEDNLVLCGQFEGDPHADFFGLFDGHSGDTASAYAAQNLWKCLSKRLHENHPKEALRTAFLDCHEGMKTVKTEAGTTAVVGFFKDDELFIANCGDSRAVLSQNHKAHLITTDHKPSSDSERRRIESLPGGYIYKNRVQGKLAVSRSLGDFVLNPWVTPEPEVFGPFAWNQYEMLILACDGLWDVTSDEEAVSIAMQCENPREAAVRLRDGAYDKRSRDNISVVVVWFPGFVPKAEEDVSLTSSESGSCVSDDERDSESQSSDSHASKPNTPKAAPLSSLPVPTAIPSAVPPRLSPRPPVAISPVALSPRFSPRPIEGLSPRISPRPIDDEPPAPIRTFSTAPALPSLPITQRRQSQPWNRGPENPTPRPTLPIQKPTSPHDLIAKRSMSFSINSPNRPTGTPKWKQDIMMREMEVQRKLEEERNKKSMEIRRIAMRALQKGTPSVSAQTLANGS